MSGGILDTSRRWRLLQAPFHNSDSSLQSVSLQVLGFPERFFRKGNSKSLSTSAQCLIEKVLQRVQLFVDKLWVRQGVRHFSSQQLGIPGANSRDMCLECVGGRPNSRCYL